MAAIACWLMPYRVWRVRPCAEIAFNRCVQSLRCMPRNDPRTHRRMDDQISAAPADRETPRPI
jgi:hypothetical protein